MYSSNLPNKLTEKFEDLLAKNKFKSDGRTLAQKRLEKIKQETKGKKKLEEIFKKVNSSPSQTKKEVLPVKVKNTHNRIALELNRTEKETSLTSKTVTIFASKEKPVALPNKKHEKDHQIISKICDKTQNIRSNAQARFEKFKRERKKNEIVKQDLSPVKNVIKNNKAKINETERDLTTNYLNKGTKRKSSESQIKSNKNIEISLYKRRPVDNSISLRTALNNRLGNNVETLRQSSPKTSHDSISGNTSKPDVISNSFNEEMEWEVISDDIAMLLQSARNTVNNNTKTEMMDWQDSPLEINKLPDSNIVHYVIDTNILISSLQLIKKIKENTSSDTESIIVIPWQVLKELDCLKKSNESHISSAVRKAIDYLLNCMSQHSSNVVWQTQQQDVEECANFFVEVPDDHIIKCCLQLNSSGHNVVLVSNDKNLRLKSSIHKIATISDDKFLEKLALYSNQDKVTLPLEEQPPFTSELIIYAHKFTNIFKSFLSNVIEVYLRNLYGNMWLWYLPEKLPISLKTMLDLLRNICPKIIRTNDYINYLDSITSFFMRKTYEKITIPELDTMARQCLKFVKLFSNDKNYFIDVTQFENNLGFMKSRVSLIDVPYEELCCKLTIQHFQNFESKIVGYCSKAAEALGLNITTSFINDRPALIPDCFDPKLIPVNIKMMNMLYFNLERISKLNSDQIYVHTRGIISIYSTILSYTDADPFFTVEDVVEFCKNESIRSILPEALHEFHNIIQFLESAKRIAINAQLF